MLADLGVVVLRDLGKILVVRADTAPVDLPARLSWNVLPAVETGAQLYTVGFRAPTDLARLAPEIRVLWAEDRQAVFAGSDADAARVAALGGEVARVFDRPAVVAGPTAPPPARKRLDPDPAVQEVVSAVSLFAIQESVQRLQDFVTRYAAHDSCWAAAQWIAAQFTAAGIDSVYFHEFHPTYHDNVVAVIPGVSQPEKTVVIGAHYDSITSNHDFCPGADDNATGTACVVECARALAGHRFDFTIKLVAFGGEELGLYGSEGFAADAATAGEDIIAAIAVDMIGYVAAGDVTDIDIIDNAASQWIRDLTGEVGATYVPDLPVVDGSLPFGASSDHASFWAHGYPAILFFEDTGNYSPYIHSADDVVGLSFNNPQLAHLSTRLAAGLVATLAQPFAVAIAHTPLTDTEETGPFTVTATILAAGELDPDSLLLHYEGGGGWQQATLQPVGGDQYAAQIPAQTAGTLVRYWLEASDTEGRTAVHPADAPVATHRFFAGAIATLAADAFEQESGWQVAPESDATTGQWERDDPNATYDGATMVQPEDDHTPEPGVRCYLTGNSPAGAGQGDNDVDGGATILLSPIFDLSQYEHAWVRYWRWFTNDTGSNPSSDEWVVQVTADGADWIDVERTLQSDRSWRQVGVYLPDLVPLTDQIRFRFVASDEGGGSVVEAAVDDFSLGVFEGSTAAPPAGIQVAARLTLESIHPNPFNPRVVIRFRVDRPAAASLAIYDLAGRRVASLLDREPVTGTREVIWEGRDDAGRAVAAGAYFCRVRTGAEVTTAKLMLIR